MQLEWKKIKRDYLYYEKPIRVIDHLLPYRPIAYIHAILEEKDYFIEVAPIEGFHLENLESCFRYFQEQLQDSTTHINLARIQFESPFFSLLDIPSKQMPTPLIYGIELFLYRLLLERSLISTSATIDNAKLITLEDLDNHSKSSLYKIKIRPHDSEKSLSKLNNFQAIFRLDGNRFFTVEQLREKLNLISSSQIELIEAPYKNKNDYHNWNQLIPLALDENLLWGLDENIPFQYAVIKPSLYGLSKTFQLIRRCQSRGIKIIISSSYEGILTHAILASVAGHYQPDIKHGLSPQQNILPLSCPKPKWTILKPFIESIEQLHFARIVSKATYIQINYKASIITLKANLDYDFLENLLAIMMAGKIVLPHATGYSKEQFNQVMSRIGDYQMLREFPALEYQEQNYSLEMNKPSLLILSSGSTGTPKAICYSLQNILLSALSSIGFYNMNSASSFCQSLPFHHIGGLMIFFRALFVKGHYSIEGIQKLETESVDFLSLVPTQLKTLMDHPQAIKNLMSSKAIILGGASTSSSLFAKARENLLPISLSYGLSETTAQISAMKPGDNEYHSGELLYGNDVSIDNNNKLIIKSDRIALGYMKKNVIIPFDSRNNIFHTSDMGSYNQEKIEIFGRADRVFISGGENVAPEEIENILSTIYPEMKTLLVSVADEHFGAVGFLFYDTHSLITTKQIKEVLQQHLPNFKIPKYFEKTVFTFQGLKPQFTLFEQRAKKSLKFLRYQYQHVFIDNNGQKTLMLIHGFMGNHTDWFQLIKSLGEEYNYFLIDLPGHGINRDSPIDKTLFYQYLENTIHSLQQVSILGYSMGGRVILEFLSLHPHIKKYVQTLILESTHPGGLPPSEAKQRLIADEKLLSTIDNDQQYKIFLGQWYRQPIFANLLKKISLEALCVNKTYENLPFFHESIKTFSVAHQKNSTYGLEQLSSYYIAGENDTKYHVIGKDLEARGIIKLIEIKEAGHNCHQEQQELFIKKLQSIL